MSRRSWSTQWRVSVPIGHGPVGLGSTDIASDHHPLMPRTDELRPATRNSHRHGLHVAGLHRTGAHIECLAREVVARRSRVLDLDLDGSPRRDTRRRRFEDVVPHDDLGRSRCRGAGPDIACRSLAETVQREGRGRADREHDDDDRAADQASNDAWSDASSLGPTTLRRHSPGRVTQRWCSRVGLLFGTRAPCSSVDRASASGAEGPRFESCRARQSP